MVRKLKNNTNTRLKLNQIQNNITKSRFIFNLFGNSIFKHGKSGVQKDIKVRYEAFGGIISIKNPDALVF